jgi:HSP20 family protein
MVDLDSSGLASDIAQVRERAEQFMRSLLGRGHGTASHEGVWHPAVDVYDREDQIVIQVELPGMKGQDVSVSLDRNHLIIEGTRKRVEEFREEEIYYRERPMGDFHRIIHLSHDVDADATGARYEDGLLTVTLAKSTRARGKKIDIA